MEQENKQEILDRRYMRMARIWAENSYCKRRQVGALIVKDKMIISDGYNGTERFSSPFSFPQSHQKAMLRIALNTARLAHAVLFLVH